MAVEDIYNKILGYLKEGSANTFRLARELNIDRYNLLNLIEKLEEKGAVEFKHGIVKFLRFPTEEKKIVKPIENKKLSLKIKKKVKRKPVKPQARQLLQAENEQLKEKLLEVEETVKILEKKAKSRPKVITKTIVKKIHLPHPPPKKKKKNKNKAKAAKTRRKRSFLVSRKPKVSVKFKFPKFKLMKNIKKLKKPEFVK